MKQKGLMLVEVNEKKLLVKRCSRCLVLKDLESFYNDKRSSNGKSSRCKHCVQEVNEAYDRRFADARFVPEKLYVKGKLKAKQCTICLKVKPVTHFYSDVTHPTLYDFCCASCRRSHY